MADVLDKLGEFVVANLRDAVIDRADTLLAGHWKTPGLQALQADLRRLTEEQRAVVRRCVVAAVDSGLHDFLFALGVQHDMGGGIVVIVDGQQAAEVSDGLQGEPYGERGWYARFSKHGPHPDPA